MLPMMTPKLNQVPSQLRSLPYRPRSSFIPLTNALPVYTLVEDITTWLDYPL
jgi:hypothetical protein